MGLVSQLAPGERERNPMWPIPSQKCPSRLNVSNPVFLVINTTNSLLPIQAKMKTYRRMKRKDNQIDHIPTSSLPQQRRSPAGSKPRTDLSLFFSSSNSQDLLPESLSSKQELSTVTVASLDETNATKADILDLPLAQWSKSQNKRKRMSLDSLKIPALEVGSAAQIEPFQQQSSRNIDEQRSGTVRTLEFTPNISRITGSSDACLISGSVVWAKKAHQLWWLAEAILWKEHETSSKQLFASPEGPDCLNVQDQSPDAWISSSSSRTESDYLGRGRNKRKRKPRVHFDDVNFPLKSAKKVRRLRIMRFLGLAAPVGSPFLESPMEAAV